MAENQVEEKDIQYALLGLKRAGHPVAHRVIQQLWAEVRQYRRHEWALEQVLAKAAEPGSPEHDARRAALKRENR